MCRGLQQKKSVTWGTLIDLRVNCKKNSKFLKKIICYFKIYKTAKAEISFCVCRLFSQYLIIYQSLIGLWFSFRRKLYSVSCGAENAAKKFTQGLCRDSQRGVLFGGLQVNIGISHNGNISYCKCTCVFLMPLLSTNGSQKLATLLRLCAPSRLRGLVTAYNAPASLASGSMPSFVWMLHAVIHSSFVVMTLAKYYQQDFVIKLRQRRAARQHSCIVRYYVRLVVMVKLVHWCRN